MFDAVLQNVTFCFGNAFQDVFYNIVNYFA